MYLGSTKLRDQFLLGLKWSTTRGWSLTEIETYQKMCDAGIGIRVQTNWANDTICGWATIAYISPRGHPNDVVTEQAIREAGCGEMTKKSYIEKYLTDKKTGLVCELVVSVHYESMWDRGGIPIQRMYT
jgi:hypothetical protein